MKDLKPNQAHDSDEVFPYVLKECAGTLRRGRCVRAMDENKCRARL